jgi:hypothetical protein
VQEPHDFSEATGCAGFVIFVAAMASRIACAQAPRCSASVGPEPEAALQTLYPPNL